MITIKKSKYIVAIAVGLLLTIGSAYFLIRPQSKDESKLVWGLNTTVNIYEQINKSNLKQISVLTKNLNDSMITNETEIIGKVSKNQIVADRPILSTDLMDKKTIEDKEFIIIKTDYSRTGGAKVGDLVSIYRINKTKGSWVAGTDGEIVEENAIVVSISDASGKNVNEQKQDTGIPLSVQSTVKTQAIRLAVPIGTAKHLVEASVFDDNGYVLVVKGGK